MQLGRKKKSPISKIFVLNWLQLLKTGEITQRLRVVVAVHQKAQPRQLTN
nr:MAG TPA: hypothetical protein [Caudoviricetes sp.]